MEPGSRRFGAGASWRRRHLLVPGREQLQRPGRRRDRGRKPRRDQGFTAGRPAGRRGQIRRVGAHAQPGATGPRRRDDGRKAGQGREDQRHQARRRRGGARADQRPGGVRAAGIAADGVDAAGPAAWNRLRAARRRSADAAPRRARFRQGHGTRPFRGPRRVAGRHAQSPRRVGDLRGGAAPPGRRQGARRPDRGREGVRPRGSCPSARRG